MINLDVLGPFQVLKRPLTLLAKDAKPEAGAEKAGPVGWWKLDESSGNTAANAAGNKMTGELHGKPRWSPDSGAQGGALEFDGQHDWVEFADSSDLDCRSGVSVAVWMKARAVGLAADTLLAKGDSWRLHRVGRGGELEFALSGPATTGDSKAKLPLATFKPSLEDNQWHHIVGVYDGKRIALYVDGEEKNAVTAAGTVRLNNAPVSLGENAFSRGRHFGGWLDDARVYTRGLSAEEVKALYGEGVKK